MNRRFLVVALLSSWCWSGCGKRGDPLPPLRRTPQPVVELRLAQRGDTVELSFAAPRATTDGLPLPVLDVEFLIADKEGALGAVARRETRRVAPGERVSEIRPLPPPGTALRATARSISKRRSSTYAPTANLVVREPVEPPTALVARSAAEGVRLTWTPPDVMPTPPPAPSPAPAPSARPGAAPSPEFAPSPSTPAPAETAVPGFAAESSPSPPPETDLGVPAPEPSPVETGTAAPAPGPSPSASPALSPQPTPVPTPPPVTTGFWIYRRARTAPYDRPLQPVPIGEPTATDSSVSAGQEWCYAVRTVASTDPVIESAPTEEACLTVEDVSPPLPPTGVAVLPREAVIEVSWSPSPEPDLARYRIHRARRSGEWELLAEVLPPTTAFEDTSVERGVVYLYRLTAVDKAGNESTRSPQAPGGLP